MSKIYIATDSSPVDMQSYELCCDMIDVVIDVSCIYGSVIRTELVSSLSSGGRGWFMFFIPHQRIVGISLAGCVTPPLTPPPYRLRDESDGTAYDQHSSSIIRLNNGTVLYLREVNRFLALVCLLREDVFERQGLIEYNFHCFREAIQEVRHFHHFTLCHTLI